MHVSECLFFFCFFHLFFFFFFENHKYLRDCKRHSYIHLIFKLKGYLRMLVVISCRDYCMQDSDL